MAPTSEGDKISHYEKEQDQSVGFLSGIGLLLPFSLCLMTPIQIFTLSLPTVTYFRDYYVEYFSYF